MDTLERQATYICNNSDEFIRSLKNDKPSLWFALMHAYFRARSHGRLSEDSLPSYAHDLSAFLSSPQRRLFLGLLSKPAFDMFSDELRKRGLPVEIDYESFFTELFSDQLKG